MAAPPFDINAPDPGASAWGPEITQTRDNFIVIMLLAAANGFEAPNWATAITINGSDEVTEVVMTYQPDTTIKMRWVMTYSSGNIVDRKWYFDKGLGAGYELLTGGTLTYNYTGSNLTGITPT